MGSLEDMRPRRKAAVAAAVQSKSSVMNLGCSKCRYAPGGCKGCRPPGMKDPPELPEGFARPGRVGTPKKEEPLGSSGSSSRGMHAGVPAPAEVTEALAAAPPAYPTRRSGSTPITPLPDPELLHKFSPQGQRLAALALAKLSAVAAGKPEPKAEDELEEEAEEEKEEERGGNEEDQDDNDAAEESLASRSSAHPPSAMVSSDLAACKGRTLRSEAQTPEAAPGSSSGEPDSASGANGGEGHHQTAGVGAAMGSLASFQWAPKVPDWPDQHTILAEHLVDWGFPMSSKDGKDSLCAKEDNRYGSPGATSRSLAELRRHFSRQLFSAPGPRAAPEDTAWTRLGQDAAFWEEKPAQLLRVKEEPGRQHTVATSDAEVQVQIEVPPPLVAPSAGSRKTQQQQQDAGTSKAPEAGIQQPKRCKKRTHNWQCKNLAGDNAKGLCNKHFEMYCVVDGPKRPVLPDRLAPEVEGERERAAAAAAAAAAARLDDPAGSLGIFPPKRNRKPSMEAIIASSNAAAEKKLQQGGGGGGGSKDRRERERIRAAEEHERAEAAAAAAAAAARSSTFSKAHNPKKRLLEAALMGYSSPAPPPPAALPPVKTQAERQSSGYGPFGRCKRSDGKDWRCKHPAIDDHGFCERHDRRANSSARTSTTPRTQKLEKEAVKAEQKPGGVIAQPPVKKHKPEGSGDERQRSSKERPGPGDRVASKTDFSKSCHQCMSQHVFVNCSTCQSLSYCNNCLKLHYPQFSRSDIEAKCLKCRGVCICRGCLRRMGTYENPGWSGEQLTKYAAYLLGEMEAPLSDLLKQQLDEAAHGPGEPELDEVQPGIRVTCERCKTSIPDMFRCCTTCGTDFCVQCCSEFRSAGPPAPAAKAAPEPAPPAKADAEAAAAVAPMETDEAGASKEGKPDSAEAPDAAAAPSADFAPPPPGEAAAPTPAPEAAEPEPAAVALEKGTLVCRKCNTAIGLRRFQPTDPGLLEALPKVVAATRLKFQVAEMWQGPGAVDNGEACGDIPPGVTPAESLPVVPVDEILKQREGLWREAALFPDKSPPPRLFCPQKDLLAISSPDRSKALKLFQALWREGQPVVVRGCATGKIPWTPECMTRACREKNTRFNSGAEEFIVLECEHWTSSTIEEQTFFNGYAGREICVRADGTTPYLPMLKLKDFPAQGHFKDRLRRHYGDFLETLGSLLPEYTHPEVGPLNLGTRFPATTLPPDLGPKTYIAYGRPEELGEGDNVTKLHWDLSDAVNILSHMQQDSGKPAGDAVGRFGKGVHVDSKTYGGAGAVWDIFRREDTPKLMEFLEKHKDEFYHTEFYEDANEGESGLRFERKKLSEIDLPASEVIHCQKFMLTRRHLEALHLEYGIQPWHFEQYQNEAVFIPAGCAHQVRNLRSCTKVAVDFVSPESVPACLKLCESLRSVRKEDKLQLRLQMMWSAQWAVEQLVEAGAIGPEELGKGLYDKLAQRQKEKEEKLAAKAQKKRKARTSATDDGQQGASGPIYVKAEEEEAAAKLEKAAAEFHWVSSPSSRSQPMEDLVPKTEPIPALAPAPPAAPDAAGDSREEAVCKGGEAHMGPWCKVCGKAIIGEEVKWVNKKAFCAQCSATRA